MRLGVFNHLQQKFLSILLEYFNPHNFKINIF